MQHRIMQIEAQLGSEQPASNLRPLRRTLLLGLVSASLFLAACGQVTIVATPAPTDAPTPQESAAASDEVATESQPSADQASQSEPDTEVVAPVAMPNAKLNLNEASGDDFRAQIPGMGDRMVREFMEYRPYVSIQQFRREIGKYVDEQQVAEYEQYVYVPIDVNSADADTLQQLSNVDAAIADTLIQGRPYTDNGAFLDALAQAVDTQTAANAEALLMAQ